MEEQPFLLTSVETYDAFRSFYRSARGLPERRSFAPETQLEIRAARIQNVEY